MVNAVRNFAEVLPGRLYRGAQPIEGFEYVWLAHLGVRTLVNLRAESQWDTRFASKYGLTVLSIPLVDDTAPSPAQGQEYLRLLATGAVAFVHCHHGRGRTGVFSILALLASGWSLSQALALEDSLGLSITHAGQLDFLAQAAAALSKGLPGWTRLPSAPTALLRRG